MQFMMPSVKGDGMRGLAVFISDIRNCKSREQELKRINKELANIRSKFKGDKTLDGYQKKKYVCKLLFIFLLGHDIDFGHMEAVNLLSSNKYTEKQIGYLFISVLVSASSDLMKLVIQSMRNDLQSRNPIHVQLCLQSIANIGSREMVEAFGREVPKLLTSGDAIDTVKMSAALCLLRMFRTAPDLIPLSEFSSRIIHLINDQHMGVVTSAASLIEAMVSKSPDDYRPCIQLAVSRLGRIVTSNYNDLQDYTYYFVAAPWLSVRLLRLLQHYPPTVLYDDATIRTRLQECLENILNKAQDPPKSKKVQHSNAKNAVLLEAINLIIHLDNDQALLIRGCNQLGNYLQNKETNLRYLALESMCLLATSEYAHEAVKKHQETVISALKSERDVSVRQRAADLLYAMCDRSNAEQIVSEMLAYLEFADYSIREEMVLKVAILAEKYATDYQWYVDTILNLIRVAGDYVSEEVWYRVIQIVVNRDDVQGYAAKMVFVALQAPACHENMVKVGGYILGEFGNLIAGDELSLPLTQFELLHSKFPLCSNTTKALLLTAYIKFINLFPEIKQNIQEVLLADAQSRNNDIEIQQRALEYLQLSKVASTDVMAIVLEEMPPFPEKESGLGMIIQKRKVPPNMVREATKYAPAAKITEPAAVNSPAPAPAPAPVQNTSATDDLLGLDIGTPAPPVYNNGIGGDTTASLAELDIFGHPTSQPQQSAAPTGKPIIDSEDAFETFICKNSSVLYESDLIQIGVKCDYQKTKGKMDIFYGNKANSPFENFTAELVMPPGLDQLARVTLQELPTNTIAAGHQTPQTIVCECIAPFSAQPYIRVNFNCSSGPQTLQLRLPLMLSKFSEGTEMDGATFFERWRILGNTPGQEAQRMFKAKLPIDPTAIKTKLDGFGLKLLPGIDPNAENYVLAGVIHTSGRLVGTLIRLEPSKQANLYRLTIRTNNPEVSGILADLLETQF